MTTHCISPGSEVLLPCPFCGSAAEHGEKGMIQCRSCGAAAFGPKWDRRVLSAAQAPSVVEVASIIHDARFGPDYPVHLRNSFEGECASGRAYCIKLARALLDSFQVSHSPMSSTDKAPDRNWIEDAPHENGNYECSCVECGHDFIGHKRRVLCKACSNLLIPSVPSNQREGK